MITALAQDAMSVALRFLPLEGYRQAAGYRRRLLRQVAKDLPVGRFNSGHVDFEALAQKQALA